MLRQQKVKQMPCSEKLPYVHHSCLGNSVTMDTDSSFMVAGVNYHHGDAGNYVFGHFGVYDGSGYMVALNNSR